MKPFLWFLGFKIIYGKRNDMLILFFWNSTRILFQTSYIIQGQAIIGNKEFKIAGETLHKIKVEGFVSLLDQRGIFHLKISNILFSWKKKISKKFSCLEPDLSRELSISWIFQYKKHSLKEIIFALLCNYFSVRSLSVFFELWVLHYFLNF